MLVDITVPSIYNNNGPLPARMARCTPDTKVAILALAEDVRQAGGILRLSDLFRSHEMQLQSHADFASGRKKAFSPPPGGSLHEAGRAMDIDLSAIKMPLSAFWKLAAIRGFTPIINAPKASTSEAWHFDCRGSHGLIYDYVKAGDFGTDLKPYTQMAVSGILAAGIQVDLMQDQAIAIMQAGLIRLGFDPGPIDGDFGSRTQKALTAAGFSRDNAADRINLQLRAKFPAESV